MGEATSKRWLGVGAESGLSVLPVLRGLCLLVAHTSLTRLYGWAPHDQRATGAVPRNHGHNTTLVAALTPDGLQEPWLIEGGDDDRDLRVVHP